MPVLQFRQKHDECFFDCFAGMFGANQTDVDVLEFDDSLRLMVEDVGKSVLTGGPVKVEL